MSSGERHQGGGQAPQRGCTAYERGVTGYRRGFTGHRRGFTSHQRGFTLAAMLIATLFMGTGLAAIGEIWSRTRQREVEKDLLQVGNEIRTAIALYYERAPGGAKRYPAQLEDLLQDRRYVSVQRYLRRIYPDPVTGHVEWGLVKAPDGGIMGVHSLSPEAPLKSAGFAFFNTGFETAASYADWHFVYAPNTVIVPPAANTPGKTSGSPVPPAPPPLP